MATLDSHKLETLIKKCLNDFHERRIEKLKKLRLRQVLRRKKSLPLQITRNRTSRGDCQKDS